MLNLPPLLDGYEDFLVNIYFKFDSDQKTSLRKLENFLFMYPNFWCCLSLVDFHISAILVAFTKIYFLCWMCLY